MEYPHASYSVWDVEYDEHDRVTRPAGASVQVKLYDNGVGMPHHQFVVRDAPTAMAVSTIINDHRGDLWRLKQLGEHLIDVAFNAVYRLDPAAEEEE